MATQKQIAANRRNAQKSTGPRTPEGRAAVRFNALQRGLRTAGRTWLQICSQVLASSLVREPRPVGPLEKFVFQQIVIAAWRLRLARELESGFPSGIHPEIPHQQVLESA